MSLIQHRYHPSSSDWGLRPEELYYPGLFELEFFDPFEDFEHFLDRNLRWLNKPERSREAKPQKAAEPTKTQKYRVRINCKGYNQNSVQTTIKDNYLIVTGKEGNRTEGTGDFSIKEFKKTFKLPDNVEKDKLASYLTPNGRLVVEIPLKETEHEEDKPKTVTEAGAKKWMLKLNMPKNIDPKDINVTCRDRDVIVQVESHLEKKEPGSEVHFYKKFTLPEDCNFDALKCVYDQNKLEICAPIRIEAGKDRSVEVQTTQQQSQTNLPAQAQAQNLPSQTAA
jgi:HSP20 family molecular chaperone IbpA